LHDIIHRHLQDARVAEFHRQAAKDRTDSQGRQKAGTAG
jgi:hypothetical protein